MLDRRLILQKIRRYELLLMSLKRQIDEVDGVTLAIIRKHPDKAREKVKDLALKK